MKKVIVCAGIVAMLMLLVSGNFLAKKVWSSNNDDAQYIASFVEEHKDEKNSALLIKRNDKVVYSVNPDVVLPVASTMKLIVALEFTKQVTEGKIDPNSYVSIHDVNRYYVPNTDGGAQERWQKYLQRKGKIDENAVSLEEVARGMMKFSSNANAEYLMEKLGLDNVNQNLKKLALPSHEPLFPIVSSLYIPGYLHKELHVPKYQIEKKLKEMSQEQYRQYAMVIHERLKNKGAMLQKEIPLYLEERYDKIWSDRLPAASANDYMILLQKVNHKAGFAKAEAKEWASLVETDMSTKKYRKIFRHAGQKNGYTPWTLAKAVYATDKFGNCTEIVFLANHLNEDDSAELRKHLRNLHFQILQNEKYNATVIK
ncbi:serine hydrolase [Bacillus cytotoxicus]|uniref:D-alanyl-D-alanine carboxypeptidase n=1 Tax=Bacillus cytotoxicus (strain DSM 22905 / CIP 110041 / 391-98 / NVH 391-98) TaxID=315749 RepID=A7GQR7_BACCN|nr:serine hydrolase [Bacillus cytotoxicus]ABS22475.1 D-alanyl-D-alanine carboxypeptidase [Bacillus cytotoxicus NVH 391-98]AWC45128.1 D-alanyl-D-alanine carboxypeptidase [Bacillus cytotoxicus]MDH2865431.1 serine hydrolase [Bacillus cytotoxicus]MDH2882549.1 serine hydrolase [Bacillus cytotoxicus]MDH2885332.1 serine hydrolase [Bacillus cytotoxicus]